MGIRKRLHQVFGAVPGAHASLHWCGWVGIAALVVPGLIIAMLAAQNAGVGDSGALDVALPAVAVATLVGVGAVLYVVMSSLRGLGEMAGVLSENSPSLIFVKDRAHRYRFVNRRAAAMLGMTPTDAVGRRDRDLRPGSEALAYEESDSVCLDRDQPTLFRETQTLPGLGARSFLVSKYPLHDNRGRVSGLVGAARDITDEIELEKIGRRRVDEKRVWFDANPLPVIRFASADQRILEVNDAAERCYGYARKQLLLMRLPDLFAPDEAERLRAYLRNLAQVSLPGPVTWRHRRADGQAFEVLADSGNLPHEEPPCRLMVVRDVSAEKEAGRALEECAARYEDLVESGLAMVWMHDLGGRLTRVNDAMADALGYAREEILGRSLSDFVSEEAHATWDDYMDRVRSLRRDTGVLHVTARSGERRVWQYHFVCYPDAEPNPYVLGTAQDVTLRRRYELRMRDQNERDALTGCHTRRWLDSFAWQTEHEQRWGCVVVDIDFFRQINASEGKARGDAVLRELAELLRNTASTGDAVVRLTGDEFAVVVPHATEHGMQELGERLERAARNAMPVAFSLGWALRDDGETVESTLRRAQKILLRNRIRATH